ncbi:MAG: S41 family peptidase [Oscillatoriaceae bacterium SKYG93]|nr:S41 family peptidase [Oscillatoriaceae bacterium SKYG93]MDW8452659.1 S41 family peptidase [Oscillatoriaceae cyanobacterium SKYGB_i_bin93]
MSFTKRFLVSEALLFSSAIAATATISLFVPGLSSSVRAALQDSPKVVLDEAWQIINREYVDSTFNKVDWQKVREELLSKNYTSREQAYAALEKALEKLGDPYTRFMNPEQYRALTEQTAGELSGVGIKLEVDEKTKTLRVVEPIENSPAAKAGIQVADRILLIDGKPTQGMTVEEAVKLIRGKEGTQVKLQLSREGKGIFEVTLTRARIELQAVRYSVKEEGRIRVGYIRLQEFSAHAAEQMQRAIEDLKSKKVNAFVLDLRGNPGGLLYASVDIARMWMNKGAIVKTVDRQGRDEEIKNNNSALTDLPLAVLVDKNSASASEILSGALQDNGRAIIIGSKTFGKALVQSVHSLSDGSGLAVTIAHYYTPNGKDISHKGITPDITVDMSEEASKKLVSNPNEITSKNDPVYARAVAVLQAQSPNKPMASQ